MKLTTGLNILSQRHAEKKISKKITLANTGDKRLDKKVLEKASGVSSEPIFFTNKNNLLGGWNPDIRYRQDFAVSPVVEINYRNDLLIFAENFEVKKAVGIVADETVILDTELNRYPVFPKLNEVMIPEEKKQTAQAIQDYNDSVFFPKLFQWYGFKDDGLLKVVKEYLITGKLCYEIIYDSLTAPKDIIGIIPLDASTLQKVVQNDMIYYIQRPVTSSGKERILHENQVICIEWNEYDFGYVSYVDALRRPFNIMRSMQTSKVLWFAAKSQIRMHIKLALGDMPRAEAKQKLIEAKNNYINNFSFEDDGQVKFNNSANNNGYQEFFTAETANSGTPEIEEVSANGPDLSETDSLTYWSKLFWNATEIPFDRIDPNASDSWGFTDVTQLKNQEKAFGKFINRIRKALNELFLKPIIIQLTLKEVEIGIDLSLLDSIKIQWVAFNDYEKLAELEVLNKKVELSNNIAQFAEYTDAAGNQRKAIPIRWIVKTFFDLTQEQLDSMERERIAENLMLGFNADGSTPDELEEGDEDEPIDDEGDQTDEGVESTNEVVQMVIDGDISEDDIPMLIDSGELTDEDIQALKDAGYYKEESAQDIADADDMNF